MGMKHQLKQVWSNCSLQWFNVGQYIIITGENVTLMIHGSIWFCDFCYYRMRRGLQLQMLGNVPQEAMLVILQTMLLEVSVCAVRHIWEQGGVPLLQQLEDKGRRTQVPLNNFFFWGYDRCGMIVLSGFLSKAHISAFEHEETITIIWWICISLVASHLFYCFPDTSGTFSFGWKLITGFFC